MPHLTEDDLALHYYGELDGRATAAAAAHLHECGECRAAFTRLQRVLAVVDTAPEPAIADGFERTAWARLQPALERDRPGWMSWLVFSPARLAWIAAIVVVAAAAFFAGRVSQPPTGVHGAATEASASDLRERVLLADLGEHLDRSQMMLVDLVSAGAEGDVDLSAERTRAEQLVSANRLYRQTAIQTGNLALAQVLDDLEQVLVDVAASPDHVTSADLAAMRQRIDEKGLLLKVRVLSSEVQRRQRRQIRARASS